MGLPRPIDYFDAAAAKVAIRGLRDLGIAHEVAVSGPVVTRDDGEEWKAESWEVKWSNLRAHPAAVIDGERVAFRPLDGAEFTIKILGWQR